MGSDIELERDDEDRELIVSLAAFSLQCLNCGEEFTDLGKLEGLIESGLY
jgi:hypothetical protein